ncbi:MAG: L-threonylcarbamoyladenylate synthase [Patescibacteria group bacterium]|nr:L-threonylcarbamoyladenylate synthase [Patescibacteria group bacterium]
MKLIKLEKHNRVQVIQEAIEVLKNGGTIVYPTETSYGLGCDFYNKKAVSRIYQIKKRDKKNPLPVIIPDLVSATYLVDFFSAAERLASKHWPGPLTLVLPFKYCKWQGHCDDYLALRISGHPLAMDLACSFGHPIVATSANISSQGDAYDPKKIQEQFADQDFQPDLIIDAGVLPLRPPSTIVKFFSDGRSEVLRQGQIKIKT